MDQIEAFARELQAMGASKQDVLAALVYALRDAGVPWRRLEPARDPGKKPSQARTQAGIATVQTP